MDNGKKGVEKLTFRKYPLFSTVLEHCLKRILSPLVKKTRLNAVESVANRDYELDLIENKAHL